MDTKKEIVIINQDSGYLMIDIANAYVKKGYKVSLITGRLVVRNNPISKEVYVSKIIKYDKSNTFKRLFTWTFASIQIILLLWFKYNKKNLLIVSNPPIAPLIPLITKNKFSLLIYDIFPDALVNFRILKNDSFIIKKWRTLNKKVFNKANKVFTLTDGMKNILNKYVDKNRIEVIPIWTDSKFLKPIPKPKNSFVLKNKLENKFVVLYSGSLGIASNADIIIDIANYIKDPSIVFVIIGEGALKNKLFKKIEEKRINNCKILPWQEVSVLPYSLASADLSVVSLDKNASKLAIPSKLFNYISVGSPVLCLSDADSDVAKFVKKYKIGRNFESNEIIEISTFIESFAKDKVKRKQMSENSINTSKLFGPENAFKFITDN